MKAKVLRMIENMLYARRNGNIVLEQKYYEQIYNLCEKYNADFDKTIEQGIKMLKGSIAASMNGIV